MLRHLIVEGPDGSGKDGLIHRLAPIYPQFQLHVRASTSRGGPVPYLTQWVTDDIRKMPTTGPWIYNRHPLISELIYAPIARHTTPQGSIANPAWVAQMLHEMTTHALVVWCMPPASVVAHNVSQTSVTHMPGVAANIAELYLAYEDARKAWAAPSLAWDYTVPDLPKLTFAINQHLNLIASV